MTGLVTGKYQGLGIGLQKGLFTVDGPKFCREYQAILNRAIFLGYPLPSYPQQIIQNQLVICLIKAGLWRKIIACWIHATDAGPDFSTLNWKSPSLFQCTRVNSPIHILNLGWKSNGTTSYLNNNFIPSINGGGIYTLNDGSGYVGVLGDLDTFGTNRAAYGVLNAAATSVFGFLPFGTTDKSLVHVNNTFLTSSVSTGTNTTGRYFIRRKVSGEVEYFKNKDLIERMASASVALPDLNVYTCCYNSAGTPAGFLSAPVGYLFIMSSLTEDERNTLDSLMVSYKASIPYVTEILTASGSWLCPPGVTSITVKCWGGGGGGGSRATVTPSASGGGGGGAYSEKVVSVIPGNTYNYIVGAQAAGGPSGSTAAGTIGNDSSWNATDVVAKGGGAGPVGAGATAAGGQASAGTGDIKFSGGTGGLAVTASAQSGGGGGGAGTTEDGGDASGMTAGAGGNDLGGIGGAGRDANANILPGLIGTVRGGGGSGAARNTTSTNGPGGDGARGEIRITYFRP